MNLILDENVQFLLVHLSSKVRTSFRCYFCTSKGSSLEINESNSSRLIFYD